MLKGDQEDGPCVAEAGLRRCLFGKFLMSTTAFLSLEDISDNLPRYDESVLSVDMDETLQQRTSSWRRISLRDEGASRKQEPDEHPAQHLLLYPDHPYDFDEIWARAFDAQTKST